MGGRGGRGNGSFQLSGGTALINALVTTVVLWVGVQGAAKAITPGEAAQHVGETVTVQGVVTAVTVSATSHRTVLEFGPPVYPKQLFRVLIPEAAQARFPNVRALAGKTVLVKGTVRLDGKKPEIVVESPDQLNVVI